MEDIRNNGPFDEEKAPAQVPVLEDYNAEQTDNAPKKRKNIAISATVISVLSVAMFVLCVFGATLLIEKCGVDTTVATKDEATYDETTVIATETAGNTDPTTPDGKEYTLKQDWGELAKINSEIKAWINIPGTSVNYPVLRHSGDGYGSQYYLHRNYDGSYLFAGSVFIDYRSSAGTESKNVITHGHNMNDGSMYGALLNYGTYYGNLSYYQSHPTLFFNTPQGNEQWVIISVFKTNTLESHGDFFNYLMGDFSSSAQFLNYVYNVKERSLFDIPVPVNENDELVTLSTCSYEYSDFRTVVVARKLRPGEGVSSYVNGASNNPNPVWPDVYYRDHGATKPALTSFKTEYEKGRINWYDGSGGFSGNEWLVGVQGSTSYTITFLDWDGSILSTQTVDHGHDAVPPKDPKRPDDDYYTYTFKGWQMDYHDVDCNMTIAPSYEATLKNQ